MEKWRKKKFVLGFTAPEILPCLLVMLTKMLKGYYATGNEYAILIYIKLPIPILVNVKTSLLLQPGFFSQN